MRPVDPSIHEGARLIIFAKDQYPYKSLVGSVDQNGTVMTEWELSGEDLQRVLDGGRIRLWIMCTEVHKEKPMLPLKMEVIMPDTSSGE